MAVFLDYPAVILARVERMLMNFFVELIKICKNERIIALFDSFIAKTKLSEMVVF